MQMMLAPRWSNFAWMGGHSAPAPWRMTSSLSSRHVVSPVRVHIYIVVRCGRRVLRTLHTD